MHWQLERPALLAVVAVVCALAWGVGQAAGGGNNGGDEIKIKEGKPVPDVVLPATQAALVFPGKKGGDTLKLSDLKGKKNVVLYFYPKALTGG